MSTRTVKCLNYHNKGHIAKHQTIEDLSTSLSTEDNTEENQKPEEVPN